jgi:hypothetical protein
VSVRKEEAEALREALSPGAWRRHRGGAAAVTAGKAASEEMPRQLTEAWMEHLGAGRGWNFTGEQRGEEQT